MGILDWFRGVASGRNEKDVASSAISAGEDKGTVVGGLDFKSAVDAHMKWKKRLEDYISGNSQETLEVGVISRDYQCVLGKWIYGEGGERFGYSETFFDMKAHHTLFHRSAGEVLAAAQAGDKDRALHLLFKGDYARASERVKRYLAKLFVLVADGQTAIDAHAQWKERLHNHIAGNTQEDLRVDVIARDDQCVLGQWLNAEGSKRYGHLPTFDAVRVSHAQFHRCAADVLTTAKGGDSSSALRMLEEESYMRASDEVTAALVELFKSENAAGA
jgi:hypothetical protein